MQPHLSYAALWLRFKIVNLFRPRVSNFPASSHITNYRIKTHRFGFEIITPGIPFKRCSRVISISWRFWLNGPCDLSTFMWLRGGGK